MDNPPRRRRKIPWIKLLLIGSLAGLALFLQVTVWTLEAYLEENKALLDNNYKQQQQEQEDGDFSDTVKSTRPPQRSELHRLWRAHTGYRTGASQRTAGAAYWQQALQHMDWHQDDETDVLVRQQHAVTNATAGVQAVKRAAQAGHPAAQLLLANALAAGFWPWPDKNRHPTDISVLDDWIEPSQSKDQLNQAWLLWHFSAMAGNIEAAMTLASRLEYTALAHHDNDYSRKNAADDDCPRRLAYWAAAAHGIVDTLSADPHSRARIMPARDQHVLYQVHLHGGTGSRLDDANRPDESPDALQYYHVRAVGDAVSADPAEAARAANTLGRYYSKGLRGAPQNLTKAVYYYEMAGLAEHWEAAGQAGMMYLWGMGVERDAYRAHKLFRIGAPNLASCQNRLDRKRKAASKTTDFALCQTTCLTGMGLLHAVGVPMLAPVDAETAEAFLKLASEQGSADATYFLAMMRLGWNTHFLPAEEALEEGGQTLLEEQIFPKTKESSVENHPSAAEYQSILSGLAAAAGRGHFLATHRLAMMYETGVSIPSGSKMFEVVPKDCEKASKHYRAVVTAGAPQRAVRIRRAYKQYVAGETSHSLRNYLAAAESGSDLALLNAAFLMEQGECLGLGELDCATAAVRLWKAAATKGYSEASLRVGDFYYYGRLRPQTEMATAAPFGWVQYLLYPERLVQEAWEYVRLRLLENASETSKESVASSERDDGKDVCVAQQGADETCGANFEGDSKETAENAVEKDLASAARYYHLATERNPSPRAHFNLGFCYEWGLGLKQDFPLAKRHYDLAVSTNPEEADVPVTIALIALHVHELVVKKWMSWKDWVEEEAEPSPAVTDELAEVVGGISGSGVRRTREQVILEHLFSDESLVILVLTIVLIVLIQIRQYRTRR